MRVDDLKAALSELSSEAGLLGKAVEESDGRATPLLVAEALVAADRAARRLVRLRQQLAPKGRKGGK